MTDIAIEISDIGLVAADDSGPLGPPSPGYVLLDRRDVIVGEAARRAARLKPRFVSHRHWERLSLEPVGRPFPRGASHADLVHAHLSRFWDDLLAAADQPSSTLSVFLAVPGSYSADQLGLLLGIARACEMPVGGVVDSALAAIGMRVLDRSMPAGPVLHLDLQQHRALWTVVRTGDRLERTHVEGLEEAGLMRFQQTWVQLIADRFVRQTRFDPLHVGASEQELYDRLPNWIRAIEATGSATISLDTTSQARSVEVTTAQLATAAQPQLDSLVAVARRLSAVAGEGGVALSATAAGIPGLAGALADILGAQVDLLPEGAAAIGALEYRRHIESPVNELSLVFDLPALEPHV